MQYVPFWLHKILRDPEYMLKLYTEMLSKNISEWFMTRYIDIAKPIIPEAIFTTFYYPHSAPTHAASIRLHPVCLAPFIYSLYSLHPSYVSYFITYVFSQLYHAFNNEENCILEKGLVVEAEKIVSSKTWVTKRS